MNPTELIAKHLPVSMLKNVDQVDVVCAFTGRNINKGIHKKHVIKKTFTDYEYLKYDSDYVGVDVAATMANILPGNKGLVSLRNYSFIANNGQIILLKNNEVVPYLINPLPGPFVFCLSFSNKKHLAFKAKFNYSSVDHFFVTTDRGDCLIIPTIVKKYIPILNNWYSVIPGKESTSTQPTYFTKKEIISGIVSPTKIEAYPGDFFAENTALDNYRKTLHFEIVTNFMTKTINK